MGDVINLNKARKERARGEARAKASINRASHGRTQAEKALARVKADRDKRALDQAKRENPED
jgi:hypothetical protein